MTDESKRIADLIESISKHCNRLHDSGFTLPEIHYAMNIVINVGISSVSEQLIQGAMRSK